MRVTFRWMNAVPLLGLFLAPAMAAAQPQAGPLPIAEYRRAVLAERGDADRGRRLFEDSARTRCVLCHAVGDQGGKLGPGLLGVGGRYDRSGLLDTILEPSAKIHPDYAATVIATKSGRVIQGIVRPIGDSEVEVATSATETVRVPREEIEEQRASSISFMPSGLHEALSPREMADLLDYLDRLAPSGAGTLREALDPREIPRALRPVAFRPIENREPAFHRPVWFGPMPGHPKTSVVIEMQRGRIWLVEHEQRGVGRTLFADLGAETTPGELTGLSSLAFHPDFARNRRYFAKIPTPHVGAGRLAVRVVERRAAEDGSRDSGEPTKILMTIPVVSEIHNGGHLAFGPDGFLYVGMGDTGPQGDPRGHGQDLGTFLGKMLRIDVDRADGERPYAIPPDNPFRDRPGARPEIWAFGFREPWRFSFDPVTKDLWVGDVGQNQYEEVAIVRSGENHGWNVIEGLRPHSNRFASKDASYVPPVFAYSHPGRPFGHRGVRLSRSQAARIGGQVCVRRLRVAPGLGPGGSRPADHLDRRDRPIARADRVDSPARTPRGNWLRRRGRPRGHPPSRSHESRPDSGGALEGGGGDVEAVGSPLAIHHDSPRRRLERAGLRGRFLGRRAGRLRHRRDPRRRRPDRVADVGHLAPPRVHPSESRPRGPPAARPPRRGRRDLHQRRARDETARLPGRLRRGPDRPRGPRSDPTRPECPGRPLSSEGRRPVHRRRDRRGARSPLRWPHSSVSPRRVGLALPLMRDNGRAGPTLREEAEAHLVEWLRSEARGGFVPTGRESAPKPLSGHPSSPIFGPSSPSRPRDDHRKISSYYSN